MSKTSMADRTSTSLNSISNNGLTQANWRHGVFLRFLGPVLIGNLVNANDIKSNINGQEGLRRLWNPSGCSYEWLFHCSLHTIHWTRPWDSMNQNPAFARSSTQQLDWCASKFPNECKRSLNEFEPKLESQNQRCHPDFSEKPR